MANKLLKTRVQQKIDTSQNWAKATNFVPLKGEICIYSDLHRMKVGDGTTKINDLDFEKSTWIVTMAYEGNPLGITIEGVDEIYYPINVSATLPEIKAANDAGFEVKAVLNGRDMFPLSTIAEASSTVTAVFSGVFTNDNKDLCIIRIMFSNDINLVLITNITKHQVPKVSTADNNKILKVVDGAWAASTLDKSRFVVNFTLSEDKATATADKTTAEISNASENGQIVIGILTDGLITYILQFNGIIIGGPIFSTVMNFRDVVQTISLEYNDVTLNYDVVEEKIESFTDTEIETFYNA